MSNIHDLDALAAGPLTIRVGGTEYEISVTVETMMELTKAQAEGRADDQFELTMAIMERAGFPREQFLKLEARQATALAEIVTKHYFPEAVAEAEKKENEAQSNGPTPLPPSSATSAEDTPSEAS